MKDIVHEALEYANADEDGDVESDRMKVVNVDDVAMWLPPGYEEIVTVIELVEEEWWGSLVRWVGKWDVAETETGEPVDD